MAIYYLFLENVMIYYILHNPTGQKFIMDFSPADFNSKEKPDSWLPPTIEQARAQIELWNRAEKAYKNEFTYSLEEM